MPVADRFSEWLGFRVFGSAQVSGYSEFSEACKAPHSLRDAKLIRRFTCGRLCKQSTLGGPWDLVTTYTWAYNPT